MPPRLGMMPMHVGVPESVRNRVHARGMTINRILTTAHYGYRAMKRILLASVIALISGAAAAENSAADQAALDRYMAARCASTPVRDLSIQEFRYCRALDRLTEITRRMIDESGSVTVLRPNK